MPVDDAVIIEVTDLTKTFDGFTAVDHISIRVIKGEIFAFLGPNGAGKTTTIKMLTTLTRPSSGSIRLDGHDATSDAHAVRRSFGIVFQDPSLDDELTAWENMEFHGVLYKLPRTIRRARTEDLLRLLDLWDRKNDLVKHFSGGMKRRLEIARGLLHHPKILFLDEPTLGLDPQTRDSIWSHVRGLNRTKGITVFFTTHYMDEADRVATRLAIIDRGIIVADGAPDAIKKQTGRKSLEEAFIALTGSSIRDSGPAPLEHMRMRRRLWRR
jgi:ABC-2 type transport system ATP-binding protein